MAKAKTKELWQICKHEDTEEGSVKAVNGDDLAFIACEECGIVLTWQRVKKETPVEKATKVAEKPKATEAEKAVPAKTGRPSSTRPKPSAGKSKAKKKEVEAEVETPIQHSGSYVLEDIKADGDNAIFVVLNDKGESFDVVKESTAEKATAVESAKDKYVGVTAIIVKYTAVDTKGLPTDGVFEQMVNITPK